MTLRGNSSAGTNLSPVKIESDGQYEVGQSDIHLSAMPNAEQSILQVGDNCKHLLRPTNQSVQTANRSKCGN